MTFKFASGDFSLCDGKKVHASKLRQRFLELYNELTQAMKNDSALQNFVECRAQPRIGLNTVSPMFHNISEGEVVIGKIVGLALRGENLNGKIPESGYSFNSESKDKVLHFMVYGYKVMLRQEQPSVTYLMS